jgi:predicted ATP-grasp superfamily ATP-dependent carboligase
VLGVTTNGLSFVRSLGRRGIPVLMMDRLDQRPGMRSRFGTALPMPDLCDRPDVWLTTLHEIADRAPSPPVLIATGDEHVLFLSEHRDRLAERFRFRIPEPGIAEMLCDKGRQHEQLAAAGWPLPTAAVLGSDAADLADDVAELAERTVGYPCILKPLVSHRWMRRRTGIKAAIAADADRLRAAHREMSRIGEPLFLQEFIPGPDTALHGVLAYCGAAGEPLALFTKQKLQQQPPLAGNGSLQVSTWQPELADLTRRILASLGYGGLVSIEYKLDPRDARFKLIEINPRSVSGNQLAIDCGIDLPFLAYQDALGDERPRPVSSYRRGIKYLHLGWHLEALEMLRRGGDLTAAEALRSFRGVRSFALFDPGDPLPFAAYVAGAIARRLSRGRGRT